jgi:F-type H+-transporting ATPase subunit a
VQLARVRPNAEAIVFRYFAAEGTGVPLAAEPIFHVLGLSITNSMFVGAVMACLVLFVFTLAAQRTSLRPNSKFGFAVETGLDAVLSLGEENFGSRKKAIKYMPLLLTLFTFILFSNFFELIPGVGSINVQSGDAVTPLLRPFTTDLNATLAMAILTIGTVQFYALKELGLKKHFLHYFAVVTPWWNPMNVFIGLIEVMGEFIRIITLSMRLFGVIYAGEVLLHVIGSLSGNLAPIATLPVYFMELFFGAIQAYLFMMLSMVYLANATHSEDHDTEHDNVEAHPPVSSYKPASAASGSK